MAYKILKLSTGNYILPAGESITLPYAPIGRRPSRILQTPQTKASSLRGTSRSARERASKVRLAKAFQEIDEEQCPVPDSLNS